MRPIGGEIELEQSNYDSYFTDSGRSSLRLFLRSKNYKDKKFLLPNFFCSVIEDILKEEKINYSFYNIKLDFSIEPEELNNQDFDVLYIINFFGIYSDLSSIQIENKILIEDNVFLGSFENHSKANKWFAFNSFRKISNLIDGSLIKTNIEIDGSIINCQQAKFVNYKKQAAKIKFDYLTKSIYTENDYLNLFLKGENSIDLQTEIYSISSKSLYLLNGLHTHSQALLKKRYLILEDLIHTKKTLPQHYSFFTFNTKNKSKFMSRMREKNIFLPNFWLETTQNNKLYNNLISIPLFNNYSDIEFDYIIKTIKTLIND